MGRVIYKSVPDMSLARDRTANPTIVRDSFKPSTFISSFAKNKKFYIKTYGCQANVRDEEVMAGYLKACGFKPTANKNEADVVVINTCAVRENAEDKVYGEIGTFKINKKNNKDFVLCVCGCMMQQENVAQYLVNTYQHISVIFGTHNVHNIVNLIEEHLKTNKVIVDVKSCAGDIVENLPSCRNDEYKASVNISYGCNKFCTYCIVPYTRGKERSRVLNDIIDECKELVDLGYKEITLLGQNVNSYGKDLNDGTTFAKLLEEVAKLGIPRLRFMTSHPWDFSDDMLDVIAKYPNIMNCIHLPLQSGSNEVLKRMGRRYNRDEYLNLVRKIRDTIPGVTITTDIIVGFPNETDEDFEGTLSMCDQVKYDGAFTFIYSPRKGTPAAAIKDNVSDETKHERFNRLVDLIEKHIIDISEKMIGKEYDVLVDGPSKKDSEILSGYTEGSKLVNFKGPSYLKGEIVKVRITENHAFSMTGELVDDPILILTKSLKRCIDNEECVKDYLSIKEQINNSEDIKLLKQSIKECELKLKESADPNTLGRLKELNKQLANNPLIKNLDFIKDEVQDLLLTISKELK